MIHWLLTKLPLSSHAWLVSCGTYTSYNSIPYHMSPYLEVYKCIANLFCVCLGVYLLNVLQHKCSIF